MEEATEAIEYFDGRNPETRWCKVLHWRTQKMKVGEKMDQIWHFMVVNRALQGFVKLSPEIILLIPGI